MQIAGVRSSVDVFLILSCFFSQVKREQLMQASVCGSLSCGNSGLNRSNECEQIQFQGEGGGVDDLKVLQMLSFLRPKFNRHL